MSQPPAAAAGVVSSSGPARQPLQTYLGSAVRPAAVAPPVATPVAMPVSVAAQPPQQQLFGAPGGAPVPFSQQPLFGSPALSGVSAPSGGGGVSAAPDLLSSLLHPPPQASPPRHYVGGGGGQTGVFGEPLGAPQAQAPQQQQSPPPHAHPQPQAFTFASPATAGTAAPPASLNTMTPSSSFTSPAAQPSQSQPSQQQSLAPLSNTNNVLVAAPVTRLEQTSDHPLSFSASPPSPMRPMPSASATPSQGHVLAGPLGPLAPPPRAALQTQTHQPLPRTASGSAGATPLPDGTAPPPSSSPPAPTATSPRAVPYSPLMSTAAAQAYSATQLQQQQLQQMMQQAPAASPGSSPTDGGEKLSTLLQALFQGDPPPAKLAVFDVSSVPRNEQGLVALAEHGCWREVVKLAEALLDLKVTPATALATNAHAHATAVATATPAAANDTATATVLPPHMTYRLLHYYIAALVKLKKFEAAHATCQQRVGPLFSADKLYSSHPTHYPSSSSTTTAATPATGDGAKQVGNMLPFELQLLATELPHFLPAHPRTRQALDQSMKLLQFLRAQITRKRMEEAELAGIPNPLASTAATTQDSAATAAASVPVSRRASISEGPGGGGFGTGTSTLSSSNPFSITSPHTLSSLSSTQLHSQLCVARMHVVNLCLNWASSLEIDYEQSIAWLEELRGEDVAAAREAAEAGDDSHSAKQDPALIECLARVHLQLGDLNTATNLLAQAKKAHEDRGEIEHVQTGLHQVLLSLAKNDYVGAHSLVSALYASHPTHLDVVNNFAVCCLYVPDGIAAGIAALEGLIRADPIANIRESVLSNLRALYDLSSSNPALKRRMLEGLILMYGSDDLELSS